MTTKHYADRIVKAYIASRRKRKVKVPKARADLLRAKLIDGTISAKMVLHDPAVELEMRRN